MVLGMNEIKFIDLFGGIGGFRYGLEKASGKRDQESRSDSTNTYRKLSTQRRGKPTFNCVWYCEKDKYAVQTYNKNFKEQYTPTDITKVKSKDIPDFDMLCGGFPCQSFSIAGKRKGFQDIRGTMFFEICRIASEKKPRLLFLENVKGLLSADDGRCFGTIISSLDELGYDAEWQVLNSKNFGVPQNRERVFIIGHLRGNSRGQIFPLRKNDEIHNGKNTSQSSYLKSPLRSQGDKPMILHNIYGGFGEEKTRTFEDCSPTIRTPKGGGHLPVVMHSLHHHRTGEYGNGIKEEESFTLDSSSGNDLCVYNQDNLKKPNIRRLTPVECERLQGFPDGWTSGVSDTQRYKQLGNAVTTNVIQAIGEKIIEG